MASDFADNKWHKVAVGINKNQIKVYMDCAEVATLPTRAGNSRIDFTTAGKFVVGGHYNENDTPFRVRLFCVIYLLL